MMKADVEDLGGSQRRIVCEIPSQEVQEEVEKYCRKLAKEVDVRGFRKGKAPPSVIKRFFRQQIKTEVASQLVTATLEKVMKEHALTPLGEPELDTPVLEEGKDFSFSMKLDVKPDIEVKDYQGIPLDQEQAEVKEEEVQSSLDELRKAHGELKGVEEDRGAVEGDTVLVDYAGLIDGEPIPDHEKKDVYVEIGSGAYKQDVEEGLLGAKVGMDREVEVEYPTNYLDKNLAGKKVQYRFHVKKILVKELPKLDDEFAKDVGPYDNLEALRNRLQEEILREKKIRIRKRSEENLLEAILERNSFEAPRSLIEAQHTQMMREAAAHFLSKGLHLEQDSEDYQKLDSNMQELAEKEVKKQLLIEAMGKQESMQVSDEEVDKRIQEIAERNEQSPEKVRADIRQQDESMDHFKTGLLREKVLDFLMSQAKIEDKGKK
jgi:trigger factor